MIVTRLPEAEIVMGNNAGISNATIYARKNIHIGDNTCIGGNAKSLRLKGDKNYERHHSGWGCRYQALSADNGDVKAASSGLQ